MSPVTTGYGRVCSADPGVDLVDMCLPTPMHAGWSLRALSAGKHLLPGKADSSESEGRGPDRLPRRKRHDRSIHGRPRVALFSGIQTDKGLWPKAGSSVPFMAAHFKRNTSQGLLWREPGDVERTGGPAIDLHIHDADFRPVLVSACRMQSPPQVP